jgi:septal ring factor EnvC (AmiA/AmiB activator)
MSKAVDILEKELKEMEKELKMTEPEAKRIENKLLILRSQIQKIKGALEILKNENTIPTFSMGNRISFKYGKRNRELDKEII